MREQTIIHFPIIDSTNTWAKKNAHTLDQNKITLVTADAQNKGRGRFNREWISPVGQNIYATYCFFVPITQPGLFNVAQILSLSTAKALHSLNFNSKIKWPNDILLSQKKLGGSLCETVWLETLLCVVAGLGLNVNMPRAEAEKINQPATSLLIEGERNIDLNSVLDAISETFIKDLELFLLNGFAPFMNDYCEKLVHQPGQTLKFSDNNTVWEGVFHSISPDGSLNLSLPNGELKKFYSGDVEF